MSRRPTQDEALASLPPAVLRGLRAEVFRELALALPGGLTDQELLQRLRGRLPGFLEESTPGRRRAELVEVGSVEDSGELRPSPSGRPAVVWRLCGPWKAWRAAAAEPAPGSLLEAVQRAQAFVAGARAGLDEGSVERLLEQAYARDPSLEWRARGEAPRDGGGQTRLFG